MAGAVLITGAADAHGMYADGPVRDQLAHIRQVCETVVRLRPGEAHFDACVASLSGSLFDARRAQRPMEPAGDVQAPYAAVGSSFDAVRHREEQACVRAGLVPSSGAFPDCVANLQAVLQWLDFPDN
jgi:hypothetical protein